MTDPPTWQSGEITQIWHFAFQIDTKQNRLQGLVSTGIFPISIRFNRTLVLQHHILALPILSKQLTLRDYQILFLTANLMNYMNIVCVARK